MRSGLAASAVHAQDSAAALRVDLARANEKLSGRLGRDPKISELAAELGISEDEVVEGQVAANGYNASSYAVTAGNPPRARTGRPNTSAWPACSGVTRA
ncbi:sigma-70 domain-containing protein [Streptomyces sp. bgisy084]|uniref:sigma-70 domain-containing protein n=1 Tax=unclassified Streptomyces TaxID=2593676 RepID=UPI003D739BE5